jgi:hypothetical protein
MLVVIGADVDPRLPGMRRLPDWDPWDTLEHIPHLESALGADLPPITWLLRADDTIRHVTGAFDSCYLSRRDMWTRLHARGHELGWHFHHWTFGATDGGFDPNPPWLSAAHAALSRHFAIQATRTGWDYCNSSTMRTLAALGVAIDFSSLPGQLVWWSIDGERILVDWKRAPGHPYRPGRDDYQQPAGGPGDDALRIWELPIAAFRATLMTMAKRTVWRLLHGELSLAGVAAKTLMMTQPWPRAPRPADVLAFHFHPEDLTAAGVDAFARNVTLLKQAFNPEFVTASVAAARLADGRGTLRPS